MEMLLSTMSGQMPAPIKDRYVEVLAGASVVLGSAFTIKVIRNWLESSALGKKRFNKQESRKRNEEELASKLATVNISEEKQKVIISLKITELQQKLQSGVLTAIDVLRAYQIQALKANKVTNAITEYVTEAEEDARLCDEVGDKSNRLLHGIPISIKDCFPMQGYDVILGSSKLIDQPWEDDCVLVKVLREQGAVPFVRTNVPQTMMSFDTCNPVFGQTRNPHDPTRTAGGSSGGEAALQAAGGSIIGLGGDIGGSIRIPASFCGTCGLKPVSKRLSTKGGHFIFKGQNLITSAYGPMTQDVDGLVIMMKALLSPLHFELDKSVPPIPFNEQMFMEKKKLRIGYYLYDGYLHATPHMKRAVMEAVATLKSLGHEVVEWNYDNIGRRGAKLWTQAIFSDGGDELVDIVKKDAGDHSSQAVVILARFAKYRSLFKLFCKFVSWVYPNLGNTIPSFLGMRSIHEWQQLTKDISSFKEEITSDLEKKGIDVIIAPGFTTPAMPCGGHRFATGAASYTVLYNVLDFPAGSMPITKATAEDNAKMASYPTPDPWHQAIKKMMVGSEGLPLNVQVVTLPWQEERCLRVMKELETAINNPNS